MCVSNYRMYLRVFDKFEWDCFQVLFLSYNWFVLLIVYDNYVFVVVVIGFVFVCGQVYNEGVVEFSCMLGFEVFMVEVCFWLCNYNL